MAENDASLSGAGARVPQDLREVWAAKNDVLVSHDGTRIDFHGGSKDWNKPTHLTLNELEKVTDTFVVSLVHHKVTSINVALCKSLTDESIKEVAKGCPQLKELNVAGIENITDQSIQAIGIGCPELNKLNVCDTKTLTDESIKTIARGCPGLQELNVRGIENITDDSIKVIAKGCPELKELNVCGIENITDKSIKAIAKGCPELIELDVYDVRKLTDQSIKAIAKGCPQLKVLQVSSGYIKDQSIKAVAKGCPKLKELNVSRCNNLTDESIKAIAEGCPALKELNVSNCNNLTDESIKAIAKGCPHLKELSVWVIQNLTDECIKGIAKGCPELKLLDVACSNNLTDEAIKAIANGCPELKELNVSLCYNLTDEAIKAIAKGCPRLDALKVSMCYSLTDESIKAIAEGCPELKELNAHNVIKLTDKSIYAIAKGCPRLKELNVDDIENLTEEPIKAIAQGCPELKLLDVSNCRISESCISAILERCPGLVEVKAIHCSLSSLPDDFGQRLPQLQCLDISDNKLTALPPSIVKLNNLRCLNVCNNPLQSPPIEIATQGLDAIKQHFQELEKRWGVSSLIKVVLVGDGDAGKTSLRNALAGRPNPRQEDRTIHLDIEKITLAADLDINVYDCGGQEQYLATQLPYLTGLALYMVVVDAQYATDEHAHDLEDKLHRFLLVLQNRVPGAIILPIVTKVDTVKDPERRCHWLESKIEKWLKDTRKSVCGNLPNSTSDNPQALLASVAGDVTPNLSNSDGHHFTPLRVQSPALMVSVADTDDVGKVRDSVNVVRDRIIALTKHKPPLFCGVGQKVPPTYVAILKLFGAIAEYGDNDLALKALRDGTAQALGETTELSPAGTYRPKDELQRLWKAYRDDPNVHVEGDIFDDATHFWETQGRIFIDAGLVILQPEFITTIVKPLVDHRHDDEKEFEYFDGVAAQFLESTSRWDNDCYNALIDALYIFRATAEFETNDESLFLSFLWHGTGLDKSHYGHVLQMLAKSGVILRVERDVGEGRAIVIVPFRLPQNPDETKLEKFWPKSLPSKERELKLCFESRSGFPTGLAERFVTGVHESGTSLYSWRQGLVIKDSAGYSALAERRENVLYFSVRFEPPSTEHANAAWKALCHAQQTLKGQRENRFPGLLYKERIICEECCRKRSRQVATEKFDAKRRKSVFRACGHPFDLQGEVP